MANHIYSKQRFNFACWNCKHHFKLTLQLEGTPQLESNLKLDVVCPICNAECIADLNPYQKEELTVAFKANPPDKKISGTTWEFPDVIPTTPS